MEFFSLFIDLLLKGGIFMIPLAVVALAAIILVIERLLYLRENRVDHDRLHFELRSALKEEGLEKAIVVAAKTRGMVGRVLEEGLRKIQTGQDDMELATEQAILCEIEHSKKSRGWLAAMIQVAPLLGILGTVWGMIVCFMSIERSASTDPKLLASGIYQALVTTLAGLMIAIPASIAQEHIRKRTNAALYTLDLMIVEVRDWLAAGRRSAGAPAALPSAGAEPQEPSSQPAAAAASLACAEADHA